MPTPSPVVHFEICGKEPDRLSQFYSDLFGWTVRPVADHYSMIETNAGGIDGGLLRAHGEKRESFVTFYVQVDDLAAALEEAVRLGGRILVPPTEVEGGAHAMFADPEDNIIGLWRG